MSKLDNTVYLSAIATGVRRIIRLTIIERASREGLWDMPLTEIDLEALTEEVAEALGYEG